MNPNKHFLARVYAAGVVALGLLLATTLQAENRWMVYQDPAGAYKVNYLPNWQVITKGNALVITSPGNASTRGVFGITPRAEGLTIEAAVKKEFDDPDRPQDLVQSPARIGGRAAIKVVGSKKGDPRIRVVEYYVQDGGKQFYVLFQAPRAAMEKYSAVFNAMIASIKFLK